jgi:hypothetical protein
MYGANEHAGRGGSLTEVKVPGGFLGSVRRKTGKFRDLPNSFFCREDGTIRRRHSRPVTPETRVCARTCRPAIVGCGFGAQARWRRAGCETAHVANDERACGRQLSRRCRP